MFCNFCICLYNLYILYIVEGHTFKLNWYIIYIYRAGVARLTFYPFFPVGAPMLSVVAAGTAKLTTTIREQCAPCAPWCHHNKKDQQLARGG